MERYTAASARQGILLGSASKAHFPIGIRANRAPCGGGAIARLDQCSAGQALFALANRAGLNHEGPN